MGILNVTPDSFSDGGLYQDAADAVRHAKAMLDEGADIIDVGGESTRPGAAPIGLREELERVLRVVSEVAALGAQVSVDTRKAAVARAAVQTGASIVNDVSAGVHDPQMLSTVAELGVPIVLMHMRGIPQTMDCLTSYDDVVSDVICELQARVDAAHRAGVRSVWIDPGLGFAKSAEDSLRLLARVEELGCLGCPIVVGPSRKRFIRHVTGRDRDDAGTAGAVAWCASHGVDVVRVHDVASAKRAAQVVEALAARK